MLIEFDNERRWYDGILVQEDVLRSFGMRAESFGEYDNFAGPVCQF